VLCDFHIHTPYCGHAQGKTLDYVEQAIARGQKEIGFSDHLGRYYLSKTQRKRHWDWGMDELTLARYYSELTELRDIYEDKIAIRIGLEVDFVEGADTLLAPILSLYPFDFLLGSIHCLPCFGWQHIAKISGIPAIDMYAEYFRCARAALASGLFQSLAHLDFIWRYIAWPVDQTERIYGWIRETVAATPAKGCLEANLNGYTWALANEAEGIDPFGVFMDAAHAGNIVLSVGSDAHSPDSVAHSFDDFETYLRLKGITRQATFKKTERTIVSF
jgi:histidinol-phosphatase (PHP family)